MKQVMNYNKDNGLLNMIRTNCPCDSLKDSNTNKNFIFS